MRTRVRNSDTFMASVNMCASFMRACAASADACIVEGMMGMFDGYDRDRGSSAEIARLLQLPVVLVVDAKSAAYSMGSFAVGIHSFSSGDTDCGGDIQSCRVAPAL